MNQNQNTHHAEVLKFNLEIPCTDMFARAGTSGSTSRTADKTAQSKSFTIWNESRVPSNADSPLIFGYSKVHDMLHSINGIFFPEQNLQPAPWSVSWTNYVLLWSMDDQQLSSFRGASWDSLITKRQCKDMHIQQQFTSPADSTAQTPLRSIYTSLQR